MQALRAFSVVHSSGKQSWSFELVSDFISSTSRGEKKGIIEEGFGSDRKTWKRIVLAADVTENELENLFF